MLYKFGLTYVIALGILGNLFEHRNKSPVSSVKMLEIYGYIAKGFQTNHRFALAKNYFL